MSIRPDFLIHCHQGAAVQASSSYDNLVGGVAVKDAR